MKTQLNRMAMTLSVTSLALLAACETAPTKADSAQPEAVAQDTERCVVTGSRLARPKCLNGVETMSRESFERATADRARAIPTMNGGR